jgi:hypothetical protein
VFHFAKVLQAIGIADVGLGIWFGVVHDDLWKELYLALAGIGFFIVGRLLERRA